MCSHITPPPLPKWCTCYSTTFTGPKSKQPCTVTAFGPVSYFIRRTGREKQTLSWLLGHALSPSVLQRWSTQTVPPLFYPSRPRRHAGFAEHRGGKRLRTPLKPETQRSWSPVKRQWGFFFLCADILAVMCPARGHHPDITPVFKLRGSDLNRSLVRRVVDQKWSPQRLHQAKEFNNAYQSDWSVFIFK